MNAMTERYFTHDPRDLGIQNKGLAYAAAEIVERFENGPWLSESESEMDVTDLDLECDW
jgi:hypothetical protein